ncbi:MAG: hypothetical protein H7138_05515 [Myxococcales bacterium]|nr:hypothetical protein [Myxococcales bacterium]
MIGGSGHVGAHTAKALRQLHPALPITIAARDQRAAAAVALDVGGPTTITPIDLDRDDLGLPAEAAFGAVVVLLKDHTLSSLRYAQARRVPYLSFSDFAHEIAPEIALYIRNPTSAPVLLLGHLLGGTVTLAALHVARELRRVDTIEIACVIDADDLGGPASQADFERQAKFGPSGLIVDRGRWTPVIGAEATRRFLDVTGVERQGQALPILDVGSLAAATSARSIRVDLGLRETPHADGRSTEVIFELTGEDHDGRPAHVRYEIVDRDAYARLSARGAALSTERLLGLTGDWPIPPGLYHPELLLDPSAAMQRLATLGTQLRRA